MPLSPSTSRPRPPRRQLAITAAGLLDENFSPVICNGDSALSTQVVYGQLLGLYAGDIVTGVLLRNSLAASGTLPTTVRAGIADSTGKILALSGNLNATVTFPLGACPLAFSATYQVINDGGYYACVVKNGVYGTNEPLILRNAVGHGAEIAAFGSNSIHAFSWSGQTDLPAVGSSLTLTTGTNVGFYAAFY